MTDIDHLRRWIGRTEDHREVVTAAFAARFRATFDLNPVVNDGPLPPLAHLALAQPTVPTAQLGRDGHAEKGDFLPPVPLPRRMWAGGEIAHHAPITIGAEVTRTSEIVDIVAKSGRSGPLIFVTVRHSIHADGSLAVVERQDLVYRGETGATPNPLATAVPAPQGQFTRTIPMSEALLLRYSALTFNSHRIHYDAPYTRDVEHYDGLVIHGPLQATLLALMADDLARENGAAGLKMFRFRGVSPAILPADLEMRATISENRATLITCQNGGAISTEAEAHW